ncbi:MAG: hypothetical protein ACR2OM_10585 [Aestuariivirgaceae bacterium]
MTDRNHELDQILQAAEGLGASASASALRHVYKLAFDSNTKPALDQIASLSTTSERARTCMSVATKAQNDGDGELAELGWLQALSLMNHMAEEVAAFQAVATEAGPASVKPSANRSH